MDLQTALERIEKALLAGQTVISQFTAGRIESVLKDGGDPVTQADIELDKVLKAELLEDGQGWLSEETVDDASRLDKEFVWIVDPLDGTREFIQGIPEFCISIALVQHNQPVAGGIYNPATNETFLGAVGRGITLNGQSVSISNNAGLDGTTVLASRSEVNRGQWERFKDTGLDIIPMGSVAYKIARVAAGLADATFTLVPKNEWDVAAGAALIEAAGGITRTKEGIIRQFNQLNPLMTGFYACNEPLYSNLWKITR